jgi:hypothetical protein
MSNSMRAGYEAEEALEIRMSLRDWFAGRALTGYLATYGECLVVPSFAAETAYAVADAMLKERAKGGA